MDDLITFLKNHEQVFVYIGELVSVIAIVYVIAIIVYTLWDLASFAYDYYTYKEEVDIKVNNDLSSLEPPHFINNTLHDVTIKREGHDDIIVKSALLSDIKKP